MKTKVAIIAFSFPVIVITALMLANLQLIESSQLNTINFLIIDLSYAAVILVSHSLGLLPLEGIRFHTSLRKSISSFILAALLFGCFYVEAEILGDYARTTVEIPQMLSAIIVSPVLEELFSKKVLMDNLLKTKWSAYVIVAAVGAYFAALHFPGIMLTHFLIGITTSWLYFSNRNLAQTIIIHAGYNLAVIAYNLA